MLIIPDVHGRDFWMKPVRQSVGKEHVVFLGDYLDPYEQDAGAPERAFELFKEIIGLKKSNPDGVTLLLGNHDIHYLTDRGRCSRFDYGRCTDIRRLLLENARLFRLTLAARSGDDRVLFSHAGVLAGWLGQNHGSLRAAKPDNVGEVLNEMWADPSSWPVLFQVLANIPFSRGGWSPFGSPVWSDVDDMRTDAPELPGWFQIFGHTQQPEGPVLAKYFMCLDCRRTFRLKGCTPE